ncbi:domain-containing 1 [Podarcis lilfordi]|uniref:Dysbindin domain-containing protein 1 n=1 Tax=Podarcis lilfordi TaxID=74358 RepID=A0AA35KRJ2_9SAUR|nr:domain-containing 1 [Podarcis lilfordi]
MQSFVVSELIKGAQTPERLAPIIVPIHGLVEEPHSPPAEEEGGIPIPTSGLLQVAERRQPLSSVSSLEVHFDLLDLTELTDMSDQELAEVFADSDDENTGNESPAGTRSQSWNPESLCQFKLDLTGACGRRGTSPKSSLFWRT